MPSRIGRTGRGDASDIIPENPRHRLSGKSLSAHMPARPSYLVVKRDIIDQPLREISGSGAFVNANNLFTMRPKL
jgi:hypothetical protein